MTVAENALQKGAQIVKIEQKPILKDIVEQKSEEVKQRIANLNLENLEVSEANLSIIKKTRAELNNELKVFEEQRKMVKDIIMKPYLEFEALYNEKIKKLYKEAGEQLKVKIDEVDKAILDRKIGEIKEYFEQKNTHRFIAFEDFLNVTETKIIKSKSNRFYFTTIDLFLRQVKEDLKTIETLEHRDRVLAKYQLYKDLNRAISETNIEIERERAILEAKKREDELRKQREKIQQSQPEPEQKPVVEPEEAKPKVFRAKFEVVGTVEQIRALKEFMKRINLEFKSIKE